MPRNVRNFWLDADIDGRSTTLQAGPARRDGGMTARFLVRDHGQIARALSVDCLVARDGTLVLQVWDGHRTVYEKRVTP